MAVVFLSYAREDFDDSLREFFADFRHNLARAIGPTAGDIYFRDFESIRLGEPWEVALTEGIRSCSIFLAVYSPAYFSREYCGKEWAAFSRRITLAPDPEAARGCLIPLWWTPLHTSLVTLPEAAARLQDVTDPLPDSFRNQGMRVLKMTKKDKEYKAALWSFVELVAKARIAGQGKLGTLPADKSIGDYTPEFAVPPATPAPPIPSTVAVRRRVTFAIAAGTRPDMRELRLRTNLEPYDEDDTLRWKPYGTESTITEEIWNVAKQEDLIPQLVELGDNLDEILRQSERQPVIVVADPWSVGIERFRESVSQVDNNPAIHLGTVVPCPGDDGETEDNREQRNATLNEVFLRRLVAEVDSPTFCFPLAKREELVPAIRRLIATLRTRILKTLTAKGGGGFPNRPRL
jgi:FxsC-like protein